MGSKSVYRLLGLLQVLAIAQSLLGMLALARCLRSEAEQEQEKRVWVAQPRTEGS